MKRSVRRLSGGSSGHVEERLERGGHPGLAVEDEDDAPIEVEHDVAQPVDLLGLLEAVRDWHEQQVLLLCLGKVCAGAQCQRYFGKVKV